MSVPLMSSSVSVGLVCRCRRARTRRTRMRRVNASCYAGHQVHKIALTEGRKGLMQESISRIEQNERLGEEKGILCSARQKIRPEAIALYFFAMNIKDVARTSKRLHALFRTSLLSRTLSREYEFLGAAGIERTNKSWLLLSRVKSGNTGDLRE